MLRSTRTIRMSWVTWYKSRTASFSSFEEILSMLVALRLESWEIHVHIFTCTKEKMGPSTIPCQRTATIYLLDKGFQSATSIKRTFLVIAQVGSFGLTLRSMAIALPSRVIIVECFWLRKNLVFRSRTKKPIKLRSFLVVKVCYC